MNVDVQRPEPCLAKITLSVPSDEFEKEVLAISGRYGRQTRMKGFRPGKVPAQVIEKMYGGEIRREARQQFLNRAFEQAVEDNDLKPMGQPKVDLGEGDILVGQDFQFEFEVQLKPEFELGDYKGLSVTSQLGTITDEEVEAAIEQATRNQARPEPAGEDGLPEDGMALCKVEFVHETRVVFERDGLRLAPETQIPGVDPEALKAAMVGTKDGDSFEVPMTIPDDFEDEELRGKEAQCRVSVQQAFKVVVPTREELMKLMELEDDAALVARARERLEEAAQEQEDRRIESELLDRLIEAHDIELPPSMLEEQTKARLEQTRQELASSGIAEDLLEEEVSKHEAEARKAAEKGAKGYFLIERIAEEEKLKVSEAELITELRTIAERNKASFEEVRDYYREQNLFPQLAMEVVERKVRGFLRESAQVAGS